MMQCCSKFKTELIISRCELGGGVFDQRASQLHSIARARARSRPQTKTMIGPPRLITL